MKALDFVKTNKGGLAMITEVSKNGDASIEFIGNNEFKEKSAWWSENELKVVDNLARFLAINLCHPFGDSKENAKKSYPL